MAGGIFGGGTFFNFPTLGPAILVSMAYIDLGKWVSVIEGGARFGFDLLLPMLIFNCIAILCQYLSAGIGMVTRKNLAEICSEEYGRLPCALLGLQAELSIIVSNLTMVLGIAHGLNLLFGMDLSSCILFAILDAILFPNLFKFSGTGKAGAFIVCIAGFALLFYVFGVLISQPEVPVIKNELVLKLAGENAYSVMALLGANVMSHNFYIHSAILQRQERKSNTSLESLFHDHFFTILFIFTVIFIVNYVLMTSAAAVYDSADMAALNFQDISFVMEQIFINPVAPVTLLILLFLSSKISALTRNIGSQVILQHFFASATSVSIYQMFSKAFMAILALYCGKIGGAEGIYQSLIVCQIILGTLVPSAIIPLVRVASSSFVMGAFKTSWYTETASFLAVFGMIGVNVIFIVEIIFGDSSWVTNLRQNNITGTVIPLIFLLLGFSSVCFTVYLAVTPLKSASFIEVTTISTRISQIDLPEFVEGIQELNPEMIENNENVESMAEATFEKYSETQFDKAKQEYNPDSSQADSDHDSQKSIYGFNVVVDATSPKHPSNDAASMEAKRLSDANYKHSIKPLYGEENFVQQTAFVEPVTVNLATETGQLLEKVSEEQDALETEEFIKDSFPPLISESQKINIIVKETCKDSGSLSKLSGLGRAGRRQFATILDEFWGNLFDFHGKLTQDASTKRLDILLGLYCKAAKSLNKVDAAPVESSKLSFPDANMRHFFLPNSREYTSIKKMNAHDADLPFGIRMGTSSWSHSVQHVDQLAQGSHNNMFDRTERTYSSLHLPNYSDKRDCQPATIHGYRLAPGINEFNTGQNTYSMSSQSFQPTTKLPSTYAPSLGDQLVFGHAQKSLASMAVSSLQSPPLSRTNKLQIERKYFEPHLMGTNERAVSSAYTKKYHSSPDISAIIGSARNSYLNEEKQNTSVCLQSSFGRMASEPSQYLNPLSRDGVPVAFDELSPSKSHKDIFSLQQSWNPDSKSLFSRQPFEELFGMARRDHSSGDVGCSHVNSEEAFPYADLEAKLLHSLRLCIMKLLKLDGSDWLFRQCAGTDEELIDQVAMAVKLHIIQSETSQSYVDEFQYLQSNWKLNSFKRSEEPDLTCQSKLFNCGDGCVWRAALVISFGVWCIHRILELLLVESRPELWGKYTFVLNRLQGIIDPAFLKGRQSLRRCTCVDKCIKSQTNIICSNSRESIKSLTSASMILDLIKDVETAVSNRKGRTGTAAGDVAFPKGKENLASVLKRYKRRLICKPQGSADLQQ